MESRPVRRQRVQIIVLVALLFVIGGMILTPVLIYRDFDGTRKQVEVLLRPNPEGDPVGWKEIERMLQGASGRDSRALSYSPIGVSHIESATWDAYFCSWHLRFGIDEQGRVVSWDQQRDVGRAPRTALFSANPDGTTTVQFDLSPEEQRSVTSEEWRQKIDEVCRGGSVARGTRILVLPAVTADSVVHDDGLLVSELAQGHLSQVESTRISVNSSIARWEISAHGLASAGQELTDHAGEVVRQATSSELAVLPVLDTSGDEASVWLRCFRANGNAVDTARREFDPERRDLLAGIIAEEAVLESGVQLSEKEMSTLRQPLLEEPDDYDVMEQLLYGSNSGRRDEIEKFLERNPRCVPAWLVFLETHWAQSTLPLAMRASTVSDNSSIGISIAWKLGELNRPEHGLRVMFEQSAGEADSPAFFWTVGNLLRKLEDDDLVKHFMQQWLREGDSYAHRIRQGRFFIRWAWAARGSGTADTVSLSAWPKYRKRLDAAQMCLEAGLQKGTLGWGAHTLLLTVAKGREFPLDYVSRHRQRAVEIWPRDATPWEYSLDYLRKKWHGDTDSLVSFARECVDSKLWDTGIPLLALTAIREAAGEPFENTFDVSLLRRRDVWAILKELYSQAVERRDTIGQVEYLKALYWFAVCGSLVQEWDAIEPAVDELLAVEMTDAEFQKRVGDLSRLIKIRDHLTSQDGGGADVEFAQIRLAMINGAFSEARRRRDVLVGLLPVETPMLRYLDQLLRLEEELTTNRAVTLTAEKMLETFCEVTRDGFVPLSETRGWKMVGECLVFAHDEGEPLPFTRTIVIPLGLDNVRISSQLRSGDAYAMAFDVNALSSRDAVSCRIDCLKSVWFVEHNWGPFLAGGRSIPDPKDGQAVRHDETFRIEKRGKTDHIEVAEGNWDLDVKERVPSCFAVRFESVAPEGVVRIPEFTIELLD